MASHVADQFILVAIVVLLLGCFVTQLRKGVREVEQYSDMLGGYIDVRYGKLGGKSSDTGNKWIKAATVSLTVASQTADILLEVFGLNRQTLSIRLSNGAAGPVDPVVLLNTAFGPDHQTFNTCTVVRGTSSGLNNTYDIYLQMATAGVTNVPVAWYLNGVSVSDMITIDVTDTVPAPAAGFGPAAAVGADLVAQIAALQAGGTTTTAQVTQLTDQLAALRTGGTTAATQIAALTDQLATVKTSGSGSSTLLTQLTDQLAALRTGGTATAAQIAALTDQLAAVKSSGTGSTNLLTQQLSTLQSSGSALAGQVTQVSSQLQGMRKRFEMVGEGQKGAQVSIVTNTYNSANPTSQIVATDDGNWSSYLDFMTKDPGGDKNPTNSRIRIQSGGNVGIGTTNPAAKLHVAGDLKVDGNIAAAQVTQLTQQLASLTDRVNSLSTAATTFKNIKHNASGKCLDGNGTNLYFGPCQAGNPFQSWVFS